MASCGSFDFIRSLHSSQETVAMISEMIHTASLIHDDVIDGAETRRGKVSVNVAFGDKYCILAGDYILSCASQALAKLGNPDVVKLLAEEVEDLVRGLYYSAAKIIYITNFSLALLV